MNKFPILRNLVACNKVELAIQKFIEWAPANCSGHVDEGVMLAYRYASARGNSHTGMITWEARMQEEKNVVADFMELLQTCEGEHNDLASDSQPGESIDSGSQHRSIVEIVIEGSLSDFPSRRQQLFILLLSLILNIDFQQIQIKKIEKGSIVLTLEMPLDSALELRHLFKENAPELQPLLDEFAVLNISQILASEPVQLIQTSYAGRKKISASQKINSVQDFRDIIVTYGQEYAMSQMYQQTFYKLKSTLKKVFGAKLSNENIEDVISGTFLRTLLMVQSGRLILPEIDQFLPFMYRVASMEARYMIEGKRKWKLTDEYPDRIDMNDENDTQIDIQRAIDLLPERDQKILTLYYYEGKSFEEIAQMLDYKNARVVMELKKRILKKLEHILK